MCCLIKKTFFLSFRMLKRVGCFALSDQKDIFLSAFVCFKKNTRWQLTDFREWFAGWVRLRWLRVLHYHVQSGSGARLVFPATARFVSATFVVTCQGLKWYGQGKSILVSLHVDFLFVGCWWWVFFVCVFVFIVSIMEDKTDRRRGGKTTSWNGQARSSKSPRGQWRTEKNGGNCLWSHLRS